ncbi:hypothetical protein BG004_004849 [Podila humilis]|nr:hypothetical protein BG004_004849 [Podila humilis]
MNRDRDLQQQEQEQDWDKPMSKNTQSSSKGSDKSKAKPTKQSQPGQGTSSFLNELPVNAATPSAAGVKECSCTGPCDCAIDDAIRASEEHQPKIGRK